MMNNAFNDFLLPPPEFRKKPVALTERQAQFIAKFQRLLGAAHLDWKFGAPHLEKFSTFSHILATIAYERDSQTRMLNAVEDRIRQGVPVKAAMVMEQDKDLKNLDPNHDPYSKIRKSAPRLADRIDDLELNYGQAWLFAEDSSIAQQKLFLPFMEKFAEVLAFWIEDYTTRGVPYILTQEKRAQEPEAVARFECEQQEAPALIASCKTLYTEYLDAVHSSRAQKQPPRLEKAPVPESITMAVATPAPVHKPKSEDVLGENLNKILAKIMHMPGKKYQLHCESWTNARFGDALASLKQHASPTQDAALLEALCNKTFIDMMLESCAPGEPHSAITSASLMLPGEVLGNAPLSISPEVKQAYQEARRQNKRTSLNETRMELAHRFQKAAEHYGSASDLGYTCTVIATNIADHTGTPSLQR